MNVAHRVLRKIRKVIHGGSHMRAIPLQTPWTEQARASASAGTSGIRTAQSPLDVSEKSTLTRINSMFDTHPTPQCMRETYAVLNGLWDFEVVRVRDFDIHEPLSALRNAPAPTCYSRKINVPFSPEAPLSGVGIKIHPHDLMWYRCNIDVPALFGRALLPNETCIVHFGAVDYACVCRVHDEVLAEHLGGYTPFSVDITPVLTAQGTCELSLVAWDPNDSGTQLRGKQHVRRGGIWYTAQSGIWQTVWVELIPHTHICELELVPDTDAARLTVEVEVSALGEQLDVSLTTSEEANIARTCVPVAQKHASVTLDVPSYAFKRWSPQEPTLYHVHIRYGTDAITSYCAFRTVGIERDAQGIPRVHLNHEPFFIEGVLDQGYWPDGLMTPPSDHALIHDICAAQELGFNVIRKHIKVETSRWYWHCDRLGMCVIQDMVSGGADCDKRYHAKLPTQTPESWHGPLDSTEVQYRKLGASDPKYRAQWTRDCEEVVRMLHFHPSIIVWSLFNEGWGQFDAAQAAKRVHALDSTRLIDATSGWYDQEAGNFVSVHEYLRPLTVPRAPEGSDSLRAAMLTEIGGISYDVADHTMFPVTYGYETSGSTQMFSEAVNAKRDEARGLAQEGLAGYVYTQLYDIEEETNGLWTYDRRVNKMDLGDAHK